MTRMKAKFFLPTLVLGLAVSFAQTAVAREHHKLTDKIFAEKAAAGGLTEVELGKLAQQNGGSQDVKNFGAKMVADHGKANDSLKGVATKDNLTIPDKPNPEQQALIDKLSKKTGNEFDTAYIHAMVKAHVGDKALFTEEIASAQNADLKQFAQDTLPVIKDHLGMIEGMAKSGGDASAHPHHDKPTAGDHSGTSTEVGPSAESKSGLGPGANRNPVPTTSPTTP